MQACMVQEPQCQPELQNCGTAIAIPYYMSFVVVMLSLFIAVILENFSKSSKPADGELHRADIKRGTVEAFLKAWRKTNQSRMNDYMPWERLEVLLRQLE